MSGVLYCSNCKELLNTKFRLCPYCGEPVINDSLPDEIKTDNTTLPDVSPNKGLLNQKKPVMEQPDYEETEEESEEIDEEEDNSVVVLEEEEDEEEDEEDENIEIEFSDSDSEEDKEDEEGGIPIVEKSKENPILAKLKQSASKVSPSPDILATPHQNTRKNGAVNESKKIVKSKDVYDPNHDHYYDDVLPEVLDEIYKIPKEGILKIISAFVFLIATIAYLIYYL